MVVLFGFINLILYLNYQLARASQIQAFIALRPKKAIFLIWSHEQWWLAAGDLTAWVREQINRYKEDNHGFNIELV